MFNTKFIAPYILKNKLKEVLLFYYHYCYYYFFLLLLLLLLLLLEYCWKSETVTQQTSAKVKMMFCSVNFTNVTKHLCWSAFLKKCCCSCL